MQAHRDLCSVAEDILKDWKKPYFGAVPYIEALAALNTVDDHYGCEDARSMIRYFLANANTWRGEVAKRIKAELKAML